MILRFGLFELNLINSELTRDGRRVDIQGHPLRLIAALAERAGEVVSREEMRKRVWSDDTHVDFDTGLRTALRKARQALGDDAGNPRFIETIPRQGFRFIAPVSSVAPSEQSAQEAGQEIEAGQAIEAEARPQTAPLLLALPNRAGERTARAPGARMLFIWGACGTILLAAILVWARRRPHPPVLDRLRPFATAHGNHDNPSFSPDGQFVAFCWKGRDDVHSGVYVQRLTAESPVRVTADTSQSFHPVWSPDGSQIAFLRATGSQTLAIFTIPLVGGGERRWADFRTGATFWFDWSGNGKFFAAAEPDASGGPPGIVLISLATGEKRRVTSPPAGWRGDSEPVFSPDSSHLAFRRTTQGSGHEDIYTVPVAGGPLTRITFDDHTISGLTFTPDGGLLFSSRRQASIGSLWWATARGRSLAHVTPATVAAVAPAVSRDGKHFAFMRLLYDANIWQVAADGSGPAKLLIDSDLTDTSPRFSPDGQHVVFQSDRSGSSEIWVSDANGGSPARLTTGQGDEVGNPIWSPDGRTIAFEWHPANKSGIWVVASDGGGLKAIATSAHRTVEPSWSHDGRFVYFVAGYGFDSKIWKVPASGGAVTAVGQVAGSSPLESPDGRYLYVFRRGEIWRVALQGGMPSGSERRILGGLNAAGDWGNWIPTDQGIYYLRRMEHGTQIEYLDIDTGSVRVVHTLTKPPVFGERGLALSPDGKVLLFCQVDLDGSDIFVQ